MNIFQFALFCDAPGCGHKVPMEEPETLAGMLALVGTPCPKCGANLLTEEDAHFWDRMRPAMQATNGLVKDLCQKLGMNPDEIFTRDPAAAGRTVLSVHHHAGTTTLKCDIPNSKTPADPS